VKFLFCAGLTYYGTPGTRDPVYYFFVDTLQALGHQVDCVDTSAYGYREQGREAFNEDVLRRLRTGGYAAMIVVAFADEFPPEALDQMRRHVTTIAWNSDDDVRWDSYSRHYAPHYALVYTTYRSVYETQAAAHPNLRLSQWACPSRFRGFDRPKDLAFSFCGQAYGPRLKQLYDLRSRAGLRFFGKGTRLFTGHYWPDRVIRAGGERIGRLTGLQVFRDSFLPYEQVHELWSRSRLSLNLQRSSDGTRLQIKSRTFEMGLSGTAMLSEPAPALELYYEPGVEFIPYATIDECVEKARFYLAHEPERRAIAAAYARRTEAEHLWTHRLARILEDAGLR
jgi:spore maturation protein CgeB